MAYTVPDDKIRADMIQQVFKATGLTFFFVVCWRIEQNSLYLLPQRRMLLFRSLFDERKRIQGLRVVVMILYHYEISDCYKGEVRKRAILRPNCPGRPLEIFSILFRWMVCGGTNRFGSLLTCYRC